MIMSLTYFHETKLIYDFFRKITLGFAIEKLLIIDTFKLFVVAYLPMHYHNFHIYLRHRPSSLFSTDADASRTSINGGKEVNRPFQIHGGVLQILLGHLAPVYAIDC